MRGHFLKKLAVIVACAALAGCQGFRCRNCCDRDPLITLVGKNRQAEYGLLFFDADGDKDTIEYVGDMSQNTIQLVGDLENMEIGSERRVSYVRTRMRLTRVNVRGL
ncbi:MAG: hypothetical protein PHX68_04295 [Alphaproteobacteria bacterium]|nr:hypothetical protein [Alphaproteobacteria bacterium]